MKHLKEYIEEIPPDRHIGWDFDTWLKNCNITEVTDDVIQEYMSLTWEPKDSVTTTKIYKQD